MRMIRPAALMLCIVLVGCGNDSPTAPTATPPTPSPTPTPPTGGVVAPRDFSIRNVHRYQALDDAAHWIEFDVQAHTTIRRLELAVRVYAEELFVDCDQTNFDFDSGELQEVTVIPNICGLDVQWTHFDITSPSEYLCEGCGRYTRSEVPDER